MTVPTNDSSFWRAFEKNELTHSAAHYLMAIMHLRKEQGYARVTDVAEHLGVTRGAASKQLLQLKERGWISEDRHRMLMLTDEGQQLARTVERNYLIMECFLEDILGIEQEAAVTDACKMEHLLTPETSRALLRLIQMLTTDKRMLKKLREKMAAFHPACDPAETCPLCRDYGACLVAEQPAETGSR